MLTACNDTNKIETGGKSLSEPLLSGTGGTADLYLRTRAIAEIEYRGLDLTTAKAYVADHPANPAASPPVVDSHWERDGEAGFYKVIITTDIRGAWVYQAPP